MSELRRDVELLLAKYAGRSKWVGYEPPRREAWAEIERDLHDALHRNPILPERDTEGDGA